MEETQEENLYYETTWTYQLTRTLFWKTWFERGIYYVEELLNEDGKFLLLDKFNGKFALGLQHGQSV